MKLYNKIVSVNSDYVVLYLLQWSGQFWWCCVVFTKGWWKNVLLCEIIRAGRSVVYHCKDMLLVNILSVYMSCTGWHVTGKLMGNWVSCAWSSVGDTFHNKIPASAGQSSKINTWYVCWVKTYIETKVHISFHGEYIERN